MDWMIPQSTSLETRATRLRQLLIRERWPEMLQGCRACQQWGELQRPEACGDCGIGAKRRQQAQNRS